MRGGQSTYAGEMRPEFNKSCFFFLSLVPKWNLRSWITLTELSNSRVGQKEHGSSASFTSRPISLSSLSLWKMNNDECRNQGHVNTYQVLIIQRWSVHQSKWDACLSSSEGLREEEEKGWISTVSPVVLHCQTCVDLIRTGKNLLILSLIDMPENNWSFILCSEADKGIKHKVSSPKPEISKSTWKERKKTSNWVRKKRDKWRLKPKQQRYRVYYPFRAHSYLNCHAGLLVSYKLSTVHWARLQGHSVDVIWFFDSFIYLFIYFAKHSCITNY